MDVLALILTCSVYPDDHLVRAMVDLASQENPHFVGDLVTLVTFNRARSVPGAQRIVAELEKRGGKPVVGLLGVPVSWAARFQRTPADLLDGCANLKVGTTVLQRHYEACSASHSARPVIGPALPRTREAPPEAIRECALRRYGQDLGIDGYAETVLRYFARQRVLFSSGQAAAPPDPACRCTEAPRPGAAASTVPARPARPPAPRRRSVSLGLGGAPILE